ncbi:MAG: hypothetical protein ACYSWU_11125 [Planctomycetota bacterium]|jgi:hypothetical protein
MWRDGKLLVILRGEPFPDRCVKTNLPAEGRRLKQGVQWQPGWVTLIQIATPPAVGQTASAVAGRRVTIEVGVSQRVLRRRRRRFVISGLVLVASFAAIAWGVAMIPRGIAAVWLMLGGFLGVCWGLFRFLNESQIVVAKRMTREFIWLKGVHPDFLAELPEWPQDR